MDFLWKNLKRSEKFFLNTVIYASLHNITKWKWEVKFRYIFIETYIFFYKPLIVMKMDKNIFKNRSISFETFN